MALTSEQKHYIKKNIGKMSLGEISSHLGLPNRIVEKFVQKRLGNEKYRKLMGYEPASKKKNRRFDVSTLSNFSFREFFVDNLNYFILLFVLVLFCYFNSLGNAFVSDDVAGIAKNPDLGRIDYTFSGIIGITPKVITFLIFHISHLNPMGYRLGNILLHLGSTGVLFTISSMMLGKRVAIIAAAIFAVHPLLIESVTWISGMPYSLYALLFLLSFYFYIRSASEKKYLRYSIVFFLLAIFSSEKAVPLFLVFPLYELCFGNIKTGWKKSTIFFILSVIMAFIYLKGVGSRLDSLSTQYYEDASGFNNPFVQIPTAIISYLFLMIWPAKLTLYHTELAFGPGQFFVIWIAFLIFIGFVVWSWFKNKMVFFWLAFFIIALSATLTPLKVAWVVAERYVYIGAVGIFVLVAIYLNYIYEHIDRRHVRIFWSVFAVIIFILSVRTIARNIDWKDEDHLWPATVAVSPSGAPIHNNMGDVYARRQDYQKAVDEFSLATKINPNYADAFHNLANTYQMMGKENEAITNYTKALSLNPNIWQSWQNLAAIYYSQGDMQKADESIKKALSINPMSPDLQNNVQIIEGTAPNGK